MAFRIRQHRGPAAPTMTGRAAFLLADGRRTPVTLIEIDGAGALLATDARPPLGGGVALSHSNAGTMAAVVAAIEPAGVRLRFDRDERAIGFALAVIAANAAGRWRSAA